MNNKARFMVQLSFTEWCPTLTNYGIFLWSHHTHHRFFVHIFFEKYRAPQYFHPAWKIHWYSTLQMVSEQELRGSDNKCVMRAPHVPKSHLHNTLWSSSVCENGSIPFKWIFSRLCIRNKLVSFCQVNYLNTANVNFHFQDVDLVKIFSSGY